MGLWPYLILYGLALWLAFDLIQERRNARSTIAWVVTLLAMPFLGIPLYYAFGKNRIKGLMRRRAFYDQHALSPHEHLQDDLVRRPYIQQNLTQIDDKLAQLNLKVPAALKDFARTFGRFGDLYDPTLNEVKLLVDGEDTFREIFEVLMAAKNYILVQYYILRSDRLGLELQKLLIAKAKSGVAVYVLYDDIGSFNLSSSYVRDLKANGVFVASFLPIHSWKRGLQLNFRNHRKLVVVDGEEALTGGLNFGEEYVSGLPILGTKDVSRWRDTHVRITGPAVGKLEDVFFDDWHFATGDSLEVALRSGLLPALTDKKNPEKNIAPREVVQVIPSAPTDEALVGVLLYMLTIQKAQRRLWIATPYFVPDTPLTRELELCTLRGVDVRLLIPRKSDNPLVHWVGATYAAKMRKTGVRVLFYEPGFMHQKVVLVDDDLCLLGTTNFDNRALYLNFETTLAIHGADFCRKVEAMLTLDMAVSSSSEDPANGGKITQFLRLQRENLSRLLAPLL